MDWSNPTTKTNIYRENVMLFFHVNKSWMHNDVRWRHTFWPTLNRVMSRCQMVPSHYLSQCWVIVYWVLRNKLQWNLNQITKLFFYKNTYENVALEITAISSRGRWVKRLNSINPIAYANTHIRNKIFCLLWDPPMEHVIAPYQNSMSLYSFNYTKMVGSYLLLFCLYASRLISFLSL